MCTFCDVLSGLDCLWHMYVKRLREKTRLHCGQELRRQSVKEFWSNKNCVKMYLKLSFPKPGNYLKKKNNNSTPILYSDRKHVFLKKGLN